MSKIESAWRKLESWYQRNTPPDTLVLAPGASSADISKVETALGVTFPAELRESYLLHNGSAVCSVFEFGFYLMPLSEIINKSEMWRQHIANGLFDNIRATPDGPIKDMWWNPLWIPVSHNSGCDHHCVDLDPAPGGSVGQVILFSHEVGCQHVVGKSFLNWLTNFVKDLESGKYRFDENDLWLIPKDA